MIVKFDTILCRRYFLKPYFNTKLCRNKLIPEINSFKKNEVKQKFFYKIIFIVYNLLLIRIKYFSTKTQSTPQLIDFSANLEYKQLRFKEANERNLKDQLPPMSINISLRDKFFKSLNIKQGSILINLHFRKKL